MYLPKHFEESRPEVLQGLIESHPLATVVTLGVDGLAANHFPLQWGAGGGRAGALGVLRGHVARANPVWQAEASGLGGTETLAIFQGPQGYISPSWYPGKQEHGKAVPTWNYCVVHAYGELRVIDDADWVRRQVGDLTTQQEAGFAAPWAVDDAPADYIERMLKGIVGVELVISRWQGKWKMSQNQPADNRAGVVQALGAAGQSCKGALASEVTAACGRHDAGVAQP